MSPGRAVPAARRQGWPAEIAVALPPLLEHILGVKPDQAELSMQLAWVYLTGPEKVRNAQKALALAQRAVHLATEEPLCWNTLGAAYYRLGRWRDALEALQKAAQLQSEGGTVYDWLFLAMTYHHLGQAEKAREQQARALAWLKDQPDLDPFQAGELKALRAEADALLSKR